MNYFHDLPLYVSSRAVNEDDEYGDEEEHSSEVIFGFPVVRWSPKARQELSSSTAVNCTSLLIAIGAAATGFIDLHLLKSYSSEIFGIVSVGLDAHEVNTFGQTASNDRTCFIQRLINHPDIIVVQCKVEIRTEHLFSFTEEVLSRLCSRSTTVTVLTTSSVTEYKSSIAPSDLPLNFLRCLKSSNYQEQQMNCHPLEQPNIVFGLSAQILTYCQIRSLSCIVFICYTDASCLQSETVKAFQGLLSSAPFKNIPLFHRNIGDLQTKSLEASNKGAALYI